MSELPNDIKTTPGYIFSGHLYFFHAFDVGDDINLEKLRASGEVTTTPLTLSKFFKNYHIPLAIEFPSGHLSPSCVSIKVHNFGAISFMYKVPFKDVLESIRKDLEALDQRFEMQSVADVEVIFKKLKNYITKPNFFHTRSSYVLIQIDPQPGLMDTVTLKDRYGSVIASALRFETETLSEYQKNEILAAAIGYFRGDLVVIDTEAACVYDDEYEETLEFFEFANIQHLELRYFDRLLDQQLNIIYEGRARKVPLKAYLPFVGSLSKGPVDELGKLKVDISVITERLEGSVKLAGEPYYSELYSLLLEKRDLKNWKDAIDTKLDIIHDVRSVLQNKIDAIREDMLTISIIGLICIELVIGILNYMKGIH